MSGKRKGRGKKAVGFKYLSQIPSSEECLRSIGTFDDDIIPPEYIPNGNFEPLREPTHEDDWLAQHPPDNQTFVKWHTKFLSYKDSDILSKKIIYFLPIGKKGHIETLPSLPLLEEFCNAFFLGFTVKILNPLHIEIKNNEARIKVSAEGKRTRICTLESRHSHPYDTHKMKKDYRQYSVHPLLDLCGTVTPADARCIVGVTMEDLYSDTTDSFTVGMASGPLAGAAIFSFARYDPLFSDKHTIPATSKKSKKRKKVTKKEKEEEQAEEGGGEEGKRGEGEGDKEQNTKLLLERSCKVLAHEIGHMLGVAHCTYYSCLMNGSGHLAEDFIQPLHLCPVDLRKIITVLGGCCVIDRYRALLHFYLKVGFVAEECKWLQARIDFLEGSGKKEKNESD